MTISCASFTPAQDACIARAVEQGKNEIKVCVAAGQVPPTTATFAELEPHLHTRCLGGLCNKDGEVVQLFPRNSESSTATFNQAAEVVRRALGEWMSSSIERNALLVTELVELAMNAACAAVQDKLGIEHGDAAGQFFSGQQGELVQSALARYVLFEIALMSEVSR